MAGLSLEMSANFVQVTKSIDELKTDLKGFQTQLEVSTNPKTISKLNESIAVTKNELRELKNLGTGHLEIFDKASGSIDEARETVKKLKAEIAGLTSEQRTGTLGQSLTSELKTARIELSSLEKQANITGKVTGNSFLDAIQPVKGFSNQIRQIGRIIPGLGFAGLFGLVSSGVGLLIQSLIGLSSEESKLEKQNEELNKSLRDSTLIAAEGAASEQGNIAKVQGLGSILTDQTASYHDKKRALQELQEVNKAYFGQLTIEDAATGKLTATINEYSKAIVNSAIQKEFISDIAKTAKEIADSQHDIDKARTKVQQATANVTRAEELANATRREGVTIDNVSINARRELGKAQEDLALASDKNTHLMEHQLMVQDDLNKAIKEGVKFKDTDGKSIDLLKQRIAALKEIQAITGLTEVQQVELVQLEIKLAKRDAVKNGIKPTELKQQVQGILEKAFPVDTFVFDTIVTLRVNKVEPSKLQKQKPLTDKEKFDIAKATGIGDHIELKAPDFIFVNIKDKARSALANLNQAIEKALDGTANEFAATFADSLGKAIVSGNISGIFSSLFEVLANGLQQFGKALIAYGIALSGFKLAIKSLNPGVAIVAGIAAIAAGAIVKASLPKLAQGGILSSPTAFIGGEAGQEAVIPLTKLPYLMGSSGGGSSAQVIRLGIRDRELVAFIDRGRNSLNRMS